MFDGRAIDDCFYCALLFPDRHATDCPRCGKRMRYQPASLIDATALGDALRDRIARYRAARATQPAPETLVDAAQARAETLAAATRALLEFVHRYDQLTALVEIGGPSLAELRRDFEP